MTVKSMSTIPTRCRISQKVNNQIAVPAPQKTDTSNKTQGHAVCSMRPILQPMTLSHKIANSLAHRTRLVRLLFLLFLSRRCGRVNSLYWLRDRLPCWDNDSDRFTVDQRVSIGIHGKRSWNQAACETTWIRCARWKRKGLVDICGPCRDRLALDLMHTSQRTWWRDWAWWNSCTAGVS